ncbi:MAG TPA: hypothetical protein ENJ31_13050 [Anaerolineae bacterium]|nr:hypothetical protein [Anaerolineae bacterium]
MRYARCIHNEGNEASLDVGSIYKVLRTTETEKASGMLRVVDNEGEDYLYPDDWFEPVPEREIASMLSEPLTIYVSQLVKTEIRDRANARGISMSAVVRTWIDERLDLPAQAGQAAS